MSGLPSPTSIPHLIATHILGTSSASHSLQAQDLATLIVNVTVRTQILGASFLTVLMIDPDYEFQTSGILAVDADGLLDTVEVNFPEGSDKWWRLCAVSGTGDRAQANLTLTFEDRIIAYLRDHWGPKAIKPGSTTRAQFVKQLIDEVGYHDKVTKIKAVIPSINVLQPTADPTASTALGNAAVSGANSSSTNPSSTLAALFAPKTKNPNKARGVGIGAKITIKGSTPNRSQIAEITTLLSVAAQENAGPVPTEALIFAAIAESGIGGEPGAFVPNSSGYVGVLQGSAKAWQPHDTAGMAKAFLRGGAGFQSGGAIALSRSVSDPIQIAVRVEVPSIWPSNAYAGEAGYSGFLPEAKAIIAAGGGATTGTNSLLASLTGTTAPAVSDIAQLTRGTANNPDEDSWDCITRLAQEVTWFAFSNGDTFYYMDGPDLAAQKPTAYIELLASIGGKPTNGRRWQLTDAASGQKALDVVVSPTPNWTFDNTSFIYTSTHTRKGKIQRKSRAAKPATPSEIQISVICDPDYAHAGDLFVIHGAGPMNGRWIVSDATRNVLSDTFTQFTLQPPLAPQPEPQGTAATASPLAAGATVAAITSPKSGAGVAQAALLALAQKKDYVYSEAANRGNNGTLFGTPPRTMDCSAFATLCYKAAGLPDPNHASYSPIGFTGTLIAHCKRVATPAEGDLVFYGQQSSPGTNLGVPAHVTVYVGNGDVVSMGSPGDPSRGPAAQMGPPSMIGYFRPDVLG
jgi:cell wall-associated NlpC family hydrolase